MLGSSLEHSICEVPAWSIPYVRSTLYVYTDVRFRSPEFNNIFAHAARALSVRDAIVVAMYIVVVE